VDEVIAFHFCGIDEYLQQENTNRVPHMSGEFTAMQRMMNEPNLTMETCLPRNIRPFGSGAGKTAVARKRRAFRTVLKMYQPNLDSCEQTYLQKNAIHGRRNLQKPHTDHGDA